jgi:hypothetical protein
VRTRSLVLAAVLGLGTCKEILIAFRRSARWYWRVGGNGSLRGNTGVRTVPFWGDHWPGVDWCLRLKFLGD